MCVFSSIPKWDNVLAVKYFYNFEAHVLYFLKKITNVFYVNLYVFYLNAAYL